MVAEEDLRFFADRLVQTPGVLAVLPDRVGRKHGDLPTFLNSVITKYGPWILRAANRDLSQRKGRGPVRRDIPEPGPSIPEFHPATNFSRAFGLLGGERSARMSAKKRLQAFQYWYTQKSGNEKRLDHDSIVSDALLRFAGLAHLSSYKLDDPKKIFGDLLYRGFGEAARADHDPLSEAVSTDSEAGRKISTPTRPQPGEAQPAAPVDTLTRPFLFWVAMASLSPGLRRAAELIFGEHAGPSKTVADILTRTERKRERGKKPVDDRAARKRASRIRKSSGQIIANLHHALTSAPKYRGDEPPQFDIDQPPAI